MLKTVWNLQFEAPMMPSWRSPKAAASESAKPQVCFGCDVTGVYKAREPEGTMNLVLPCRAFIVYNCKVVALDCEIGL